MVSKLGKIRVFHSWGRWEDPKVVSDDSELFRVLVEDGISSCKYCEATCAFPGVPGHE